MSSNRSLLITVTGRDRPGVSSALFDALSGFDVQVLDVEQVTIHGRLTLATLVSAPEPTKEVQLRDTVAALGKDLSIDVDITAADPEHAVETGTIHVTVIGAPLTPKAVAQVATTIAHSGANIDRITRMASQPVTALELDISGSDVGALQVALAETALINGVDIAVQRGGLARRAKRLVVMDVDSTLIQDEVIDLLAQHAGVAPAVAEITESAMSGEIDFAQALQRRVALLEGLDQSVITKVQQSVRLTPGAQTLVRTLQKLDHHVALVSGGFIEVIEPLVSSLGISLIRANSLEIEDGKLTGRVVGKIIDRKGKAESLLEFATLTGTALEQTVAIGDGANDLDMIALAGLGIAFNAKQVVRDSADTSLSAPYLDSVLYLLGIPAEYAIRD